MRTFEYEGYVVSIVPDSRKGKPVFWFCVDGRPINFVSNEATAMRHATNFIDVVTSAQYSTSRKVHCYKERTTQ